MKKNIYKKIILVVGLFTSCEAFAQYTWQALPNAPASWRFDDMYFLNPQKGWAINPRYHYLTPNQYGRVFTTNDGGQTWQKISDSSETFIRCVGFTDTLNGWFGNLADTTVVNGYPLTTDTIPFYHTTDGGYNWSPVTNIPNPQPKGICGISVVNDSVVYAYGKIHGPAYLIKTSDKGQTWVSQDMSAYASGLVDGYFINQDTGYVTGHYGNPEKALILSTFDGGNSWQVRYQANRSDEVVWKIVFPSRNIGYATIEYLGTSFPYNTYFLKTTDGGLTWNEKPFISSYNEEGIGFINDSVGWIGGDCCQPINYKTIDGGDNWTSDPTFGVQIPPYNLFGGYSMNRFRKFGDTLMYASGNTIYKLNTTGLGVNSIPASPSMNIFPNPSNGLFQIINLPLLSKIEITNVIGKKIHQQTFKSTNGQVDLREQLNGIYFLQIKTEQEIDSKKIIISR